MGSLVRIEQNSTSYDHIQKCDISSLRNDKNRSLGSVATSHKTSQNFFRPNYTPGAETLKITEKNIEATKEELKDGSGGF